MESDSARRRDPHLNRRQEASRIVRQLNRDARSTGAGNRSPLQPGTPRADDRELRHRQEAVQSDERDNEQDLLD